MRAVCLPRRTVPDLQAFVAWTVCVFCVCLGPKAYAVPRVIHYVLVQPTPTEVDFGDISQPGDIDAPTPLCVRIASNCNRGGGIIATAGLSSSGGGTIPPDRIFVKIPGTAVFVPLSDPVQFSPPCGPANTLFELELRIRTLWTDPAGEYTGTLELQTAAVDGFPASPVQTVSCSLEISPSSAFDLEGTNCYFHIGKPLEVTEEDVTSHVVGNLATNAGMLMGLCFVGTDIGPDSFQQGGGGRLTGRIYRALAGTTDVLGRSIADEAIDLMVLLSWDGGQNHNPPLLYGTSPDGTIDQTLWWLIGNGQPGVYSLDWQFHLLPEAAHPDGNYGLSCQVVVTPQM